MLMHRCDGNNSIIEQARDSQQFGRLEEIKQAKQMKKKTIHISTIDKSIKITPIKYVLLIQFGVHIYQDLAVGIRIFFHSLSLFSLFLLH